MSTILFSSEVAQKCGNNGIIKAVLLNYIYNYHKQNHRKGVGSPAMITLREFVYQYGYEDMNLWKRSFIHKILKDLTDAGHLLKTLDNNVPVYSVSSKVAFLLKEPEAKIVSFDLETACKYGIHIAIVSRYLKHVISRSPHGISA